MHQILGMQGTWNR